MNRISRAVIGAAAGLGLIAAAPIHLASVRATYEVSLAKGLPGGAVAMRGRTVIEFRNTCAGYQTTQRFLADTSDAQNNVSRSDFVVKAKESKSGRTMRFDVTNMIDGTLAERYVGRALRHAEDAGTVTLDTPADTEFPLPAGTLFPTGQTLAVIEAAEAGRRTYNGPVFQGGGKTDLYYSTAVIGSKLAVGDPSRQQVAGDADVLSGVAAWPVLLSYYDNTGGTPGETPEYEVAAHLYANGILGTMTLIYPRFTLKAKLKKIERLSSPPC